jgi:hypothetical protein
MESHQEQFERHRLMLQSPPKGPAVADHFRVADYSPRVTGAHSELQPCLKSDHAWTAIATQTDAQ